AWLSEGPIVTPYGVAHPASTISSRRSSSDSSTNSSNCSTPSIVTTGIRSRYARRSSSSRSMSRSSNTNGRRARTRSRISRASSQAGLAQPALHPQRQRLHDRALIRGGKVRAPPRGLLLSKLADPVEQRCLEPGKGEVESLQLGAGRESEREWIALPGKALERRAPGKAQAQ